MSNCADGCWCENHNVYEAIQLKYEDALQQLYMASMMAHQKKLFQQVFGQSPIWEYLNSSGASWDSSKYATYGTYSGGKQIQENFWSSVKWTKSKKPVK